MSTRGRRIVVRLVWWGCIIALGMAVPWWLPRVAPAIEPHLIPAAHVMDADDECVVVDEETGEVTCAGDFFGIEGWIATQLGRGMRSLTGAVGKQTLELRPEALDLMAPDDPSGFHGLSFGIARGGVALLLTVGGLWLMSHETLQNRFTLKDLAPRVVLGVIGMELSLRVLAWTIAHTNAVIDAILDTGLAGVGEEDVGRTIMGSVRPGSVTGDSWLTITLLLGIVIMLTFLILGVVFRTLVLTLLAIVAPVALVSYVLPFTAGFARLWWRVLGACVISAIAQAMVLVLWFNLFFSENRRGDLVPSSENLGPYIARGTILILLLMMHKALSIPMKRALAPIGGNPLGPVGQFVRGLLVAKTFGLAGGGLRAARATTATAAAPVAGAEAPASDSIAAPQQESSEPSHPAMRYVPVEDLHGAVTPRRRLGADEYRPRKPFLSPAPPLPPSASSGSSR
ncbi:hypothetical protein Afil01_31420 [Actinorhabdospora filicis]|uniref:TrbL/VirB6 plasmid conjugal transfer protein n=1 Tax=Actinorhabdospora filicis TaxID=1785913 RepID=A0A9W6WB46_9ACTN|nr:hypothetical protein [Actinorhabdospora filicis]GLZ78335.1 hypothetical protein Afil01_31420 [Actinorhabdospora filicis]